MNPTWDSAAPPPVPVRPGFAGALRVALRLAALATLIFGGFVLLLLVRLVERPIFGLSRPWTPHIVRLVSRSALRIIGLRFRIHGTPMRGRGAVVANHSSWLDIFVLNAAKCIYFVSKSEVAGWPGIGWLARGTGTVFIERSRTRARDHAATIRERLLAGHKLLFFPEGTSTDGQLVLPFKPTLFEAFLAPRLKDEIAVQPVSVIYKAPEGADPRFYGWWGDMALGPHLVAITAPARGGTVDVIYHPPLAVADFADRKALALACERQVRAGHARLLVAAQPRN